ncbi:MAG: phosphopantothenoylcysteine decarboxylase [Verrucomicrobiae bacterium]|nr:phosphopantothenoylcysteine decarboxylase [Verrucomicrobiae bacterium]
MRPHADPRRKKTVLLGVTGSIAAYKAAEIASALAKQGCAVHTVMTHCATRFVAPLTFRALTKNPVTLDLFAEGEGRGPTHIELADRADLLLIAPATANLLAKLAHGLADDALSAIALACRAPTLVVPAMNGKMWEHPATRENVRLLESRGVEFLGPEEGLLACGYEGLGRLWKVEGILDRARALLGRDRRRIFRRAERKR